MRDALDISDLAKTSIFIIPFISIFTLIGAILRVSGGITERGFDEEVFFSKGLKSTSIEIFLTAFTVGDFLFFIFFGSGSSLYFWPIGFIIIFPFWLEGKLMDRFKLDILSSWTIRILLILALFVLYQGVKQANDSIKSKSYRIATTADSDIDFKVIRRYSAHLILFNEVDEFLLTDFLGNIVFRWPYLPRAWSGLICKRPLNKFLDGWFLEECKNSKEVAK